MAASRATSEAEPVEAQGRRRGRATPPQGDIVSAALTFIDAHGLDRFSLKALAAELGMHQPNMYRRFASRRELLDLVVDEIMAEAGEPGLDRSDWHAWLLDWAARVRRAWQRHPRAGALIYHGGEVSRTAMDNVFGVLLASFPADVVVVTGKAYLSHVLGATLLEVRAFSAGDDTASEATQVDDADASSYPNAVRFGLLESQGEATQEAAERDFLRGLSILLDGFREWATA